MQLYRTNAISREDGEPIPAVSWQASQTEASKARSALKAAGFKAESHTVNIPTSKGGLIDWLNENATT